jgi:ligand-binding sensor domain-containing protein/signal transduction histidine kinase
LLLVCSQAALAQQRSPRFVVDCWHPDEGLPNNALSDVMQTRDGYLWIGSWAGAVRFDGIRFTPILSDLPNDHVRAFFEASDGATWIGVSGSGVVRRRHDRIERVFTTADGLAGSDAHDIVEDAAHRIWVATESGLSVIEGDRIRTMRRADGLANDVINALATSRDGRVWIATPAGVCTTTGNRVSCESSTAPANALAILEDRSGVRWVGTTTGLASSGGDSPCTGRGCFGGQTVSALFESRDGAIWAGFGNGGVARFGEGGWTSYGAGTCMPTGGPVVAMDEDAEGSIWAATYNAGLGRLKRARVSTYSTADGLPNKVIGSIVQDARGEIWVGTQCGPVSLLRGDRFVPQFQEYTRDACAWVLWPSRDGALWIGTRGHGVFRWRDGTMLHLGTAEGLSDLRIAGLFEDRDGTIWIGTEFGGVHTYANGRLSKGFGPADGVATGFVASFAQDRNGRVWIGSNANGLSIYEGGTFRRLRGNDAPPTDNIAGLLIDSRGDLWIGSAANGLFRYRNNRFESFGPAEGLGDRLVAVVVESTDGNLWVHTAQGISRLERAQIDAVAERRAASLSPLILGRDDGLRTLEGSGGGLDPSGLRSRDGRLWFSTIDGIVVIDPTTFPTNTVPPKVAIEHVRLGGALATLEPNGSIRVPAGTSQIEIDYTAFSLLIPKRVQFKYRLAGEAWQDVGARRTAYYTRLTPATYRFEVLGANNDGVWATSPAVIDLVVAPFWWERWWAQGAGLLALLAATAFAVRSVSLRRARARVTALENEQALERERSRIARDLHDDLGARLAQIALIAEGAPAPQSGDRISSVAREAMRTMDELVWTVNARNDTVASLAEFAAEFAEEHLGLAGVRCRLQFQENLEGRWIAADTRRHLFLAFKEAIHNIVKHAGATEVRIALTVEGDFVILTVADNGSGMPDTPVSGTGNGLRNMRERMHGAGGTLDVDTPPGGGTRLIFTVPVRTALRPLETSSSAN